MDKPQVGEYRYRIKSTGESSARYGDCEVCGKWCSEVYSQRQERYYSFYSEHYKRLFNGWTLHKCHCLFGHKECLENEQVSHDKNASEIVFSKLE